MANLNKDAFFKYQEFRAKTGYGSAILVKEQNKEKYSLLIASETVPSVFGNEDSVEFDLVNSPVKGKIAGKTTLEDKEVECLHHRDNVYRMAKLKGKVLDFMIVNDEFVGYAFTGTISYRVNDMDGEVAKGTYTIHPMSANTDALLNVRGKVEETLSFAHSIPETVKAEDYVDLTVVQGAVAGLSATAIKVNDDGSDGTSVSLTTSNMAKVQIPAGTSGLIAITVSATGYASWTTTIYVESKE